MEKIYLVIEHYTFEGQFDDIKVTPYKSKESAIKHFQNQVHREKVDSWIATEKNVVEEFNDEFYGAYTDGYAMEYSYSTSIYIEESEVLN